LCEARCEYGKSGEYPYARSHEYLVSGKKGIEDAKEWQFVFVLRKPNLCTVYGVSTESQRNEW
jgi:hypothetical protein